jgi:glycosyltransferase involved in cell wall biosynthesis
MSARAVVFGCRAGDLYRAGRTLRALGQAGLEARDGCGVSAAALAALLTAGGASVWLVRAGAWPVQPGRLCLPPPSATGLPLCALGWTRLPAEADPARDGQARLWAALQAETGGDFAGADRGGRLPPVASAFLEAPAVAAVARRLERGEEIASALRAELGSGGYRVVHAQALDVYDDSALRVVQVVTSLQRGGAERVTLDLAEELGRAGTPCRVVTLGDPTRAAFPAPPGTVSLARLGGGRQQRLRKVAEVALAFGADLVHGHLLGREDAAGLAALGLPLLLTVHNMRPGWPAGLAEIHTGEAALLVACARAVEDDLRAARVPVPVRTAWNGIDFTACPRTPGRVEAGRRLWQHLGLGAKDLVLLALANPRPQKRLHLLPAVLAATRAELARRGDCREVRLLLAGEASRVSREAAEAVAAARAEVARLGVSEYVHWLGAVEDLAPVLMAADVLVSASAYEGLSLAHIEALAAELPVVATDAGGTAELARGNPAVSVLPCDAEPGRWARTLADVSCRRPAGGRAAAAVHFTRTRMAERYRWLYPRALAAARPSRAGRGLWLVINNLSTGGAQSSARRLLLGLAAEGVPVRAAVLEEQPEYPTPGRAELTAAGVRVVALPPAGTVDAAEAVAALLEHLDADPPRAVLLWNALASYKVLLVDALLDVPLYDVSPGEMYFTSLEQYFSRPRPGLPYLEPRDYGARLAGVIVKYEAEAPRAAAALGCPVHVIPNGVPLADPVPARPAGGTLVLGTAARVSPQKKLEELLAALRLAQGRLPPHVLRVAGGVERGGDGYADQLRRLADGLPVEWPGEASPVGSFLRGLDLFVLVAEPAGCPNASLEAMAAGLPVVATDVGGMAEQVEDGVTGRLVPRGDAAALADALADLAGNPALRAEYGAAARARVAARFGLHRMVRDYCRVCLEGKASALEDQCASPPASLDGSRLP